jgi:hypothetical protein
MTLLDELARRVARLTAAEAGALADAYGHLRDTKEIRAWYGELQYAMAYASQEWNDLCDRAYEVARPFKDTETWHPLIDVGLCIADPPDPLIAEALLAPWRRVIVDTLIDPFLRVEPQER